MAGLSLALIAAIGVIVWKASYSAVLQQLESAVLPFENLSNDREDASFADGVRTIF
jgi:TolB-like protein